MLLAAKNKCLDIRNNINKDQIVKLTSESQTILPDTLFFLDQQYRENKETKLCSSFGRNEIL